MTDEAADVKQYLAEKVTPVLEPALESLLRHVFQNSKVRKQESLTSKFSVASTSHYRPDSLDYSPLLWLSDHLRQFSQKPGIYKDKFTF
jgi:hypothetical protein